MPVWKPTRRELLSAGAAGAALGGAGLVLGVWYGARRERWSKRVPPRDQAFAPSVFLAIDLDGLVTVWVPKSEMGQGVHTALPMIIAEELEADWSMVRIEQAIAGRNYGDQLTGVSTSVRNSWEELRRAGASARQMLIRAAAEIWSVTPSSCAAERGRVVHLSSGRRLGYGALAQPASRLPLPGSVALKDPKNFWLLGTRVARLDVPAKVDGSAKFGIDVRLPGLHFATVARSKTVGGTLVRFEDAAARAIPGVRDVFAIGSGVAVLAEGSWPAIQGRSKLAITWDDGPHRALSSAEIEKSLSELAEHPGAVAQQLGELDAAIAGAKRVVRASYSVPYLAHATMEPINCTAHVEPGRCEIWAPTQSPQGLQEGAAAHLGLEPAQVIVHTTLLGTGFGRRVEQDEMIEAVSISKRAGCPVQVLWTREDDVQHDCYRPPALHRMRAALDAQDWPIGWGHRIVSPSILGQFPHFKEAVDPVGVEGAIDLPYRFASLLIEYTKAAVPVRLGFWRSVGHSSNAYAVECFLDELAAAAGKDPVELRRRLLSDAPRPLAVLELAAEKAGWGTPLPEGRHRGVAFHASFGSHVAQIVEVSVGGDGTVRVHRVVCAVDCGMTVNPDIIEAQMEGGIAFGLSAALHGAITIAEGKVVQSNFHDYPLLRMREMPQVEVHIVRSAEAPGGVGEIAVPPIAPALCNAVFAATGERVRSLPIRLNA